MNHVNADRLLLCLCWAIYLGMVITGGGLAAFLAGWQHGLVIAAAIAFVLLAGLAWWGNHGGNQGTEAAGSELHQHGVRTPAEQVIQTLVHCLPLFLIAALGVSALGGQAFATSGFRTTGAGAAAPAVPAGAPPADYTIADVYAGVGADPPVVVAPAPDPVSLVGMAYAPSDEDYPRLPGNLTREQAPLLLYRFQITCCAADATPLFVTVLGLDRTRFANDTWVSLTGRLDPPAPPSNVAVLHVSGAEAVKEPTEPYLRRRF